MRTHELENRRSILLLGCLAAGLLVGPAACGDSDPGTPDASTDGTVDASDAQGFTDAQVTDASVVVTPDGGSTGCVGAVCDEDCAVYVDHSVSSPGYGDSPQTAMATVSAGVDAAAALAGECCTCEVRVAEGRYRIYQQSVSDTVRLRERVVIYGGFPAGFTEARDPARFLTILDGQEEDGPGFVLHVVTGADGARLDGFTVTGGRARADTNVLNPENYGGGMINLGTAPTVVSCVFQGNEALFGGGVYNSHSTAEFRQCRFEGNLADLSGGAMNNQSGTVIVDRCDVRANHADDGGGLYLGPGSHDRITNTTFWSNTAAVDGGGAVCDLSSPVFVNTTFNRNSAAGGGALRSRNDAHPVVTNSILWGNTPDEIAHLGTADATVTYSDVLGGCTVITGCTTDDTDNLDVYPYFVDADSGDLRLWLSSPLVDQGDNTAATGLPTDLEGDVRILDGDDDTQAVVDIGADEVSISLPLPVVYVDHAATGAGDGTSWADAYPDLQSALTSAFAYQEIWVAMGTYVPSDLGDVHASFVLPAGVLIYGGFDPGNSITTMAQRDPVAYETVLSGDIMGDDTIGTNQNNSHLVVTSGNLSLLDGFTVTAGYGNAMSSGNYLGTCMRILAGHNPTVRNCRFTGCVSVSGGAVYAEAGSTPTFVDSTFGDNIANQGAGGAILLHDAVAGTSITGCTFDNNHASVNGGAVYVHGGQSVIIDGCTFTDNTADAWSTGGGAVMISGTDGVLITGTTLSGNSAPLGGAMIIDQCTGVSIEDTTFDGNQASYQNINWLNCVAADNFYNAVGGGVYVLDSDVLISGSTFTGNTAVYTGNAPCDGGFDEELYLYFFGAGGGVFAQHSTLDVVGTTFDSNVAQITGSGCYSGNGGGLATYDTALRAVNVVFWSNGAYSSISTANCESGSGGGFWSMEATGDLLANIAFEGNAASGISAALAIARGVVSLYNVTATGHSKEAVFLQSGRAYLYNSIFWGNSGFAPLRDFDLHFDTCSSERRVFSYYTDIWNDAGHSGCLPGCSGSNGTCVSPRHHNPLFVNAGTNPPDLTLQSGSPSVNAGSNTYLPEDWLDIDGDGDTTEPLPLDLNGNPRVVGGTPDLGPYERQ